jgi:hypothetical protein
VKFWAAVIWALIVFLMATLWIAYGYADAKPARWTETQAEGALLSRAHIAYADCLPLAERGRRFLCLIEYTDGGQWFLVLVPEHDGFAVRKSVRA